MKKLVLLFLISLSGFSQTLDLTFNSNHQGPYRECIGTNALVTDDGKLLASVGLGINRYNSDGGIDNTFTPISCYCGGGPIFKGSNGKFGVFDYSLDELTGLQNLHLFNQDGSAITSFTEPVFSSSITTSSSGIYDMLWQADGKIIIVGGFETVNGLNYKGIVRLNADGSVDTTFNPGTGANGGVFSVFQQADGKYVLGGGFTTFNGQTKHYVVRINSDGSIDSSFYSYTTTYGFNNIVRNVEVQSDGKILTSGADFVNSSGTHLSSTAARLMPDGTRDSSFSCSSNLSYNKILILPSGKYLAFNYITSYYLIRLNSNGSQDTTFSYNSTIINHATGGVELKHTFQNLPGNKILINSDYISPTGLTREGVHRINENGTIDLTFNPQQSTNKASTYLKVLRNNKVIVLGGFTAYNDTPSGNLMARLTENGELDTNFTLDSQIQNVTGYSIGVSYSNSLTNIKDQDDNKLLILGAKVNGVNKYIIRINENGSLDTSFNYTGNAIVDFEILDSGKILVITSNPAISGTFILARYNSDGSLDSGFTSTPFYNGSTGSVKLIKFYDGTLFLMHPYHNGGDTGLFKLNADGTLDSTFSIPLTSGNSVENVFRLSSGVYLVPTHNSATESIIKVNNVGAIDTSFSTIYNYSTYDSGQYSQLFVNSENKIFVFRPGTFFIYDSNGILLQDWTPLDRITMAQQGCDNLLVSSGTFDCPEDLKRYILFTGTITPLPSGISPQPFVANYTLANLIVAGSNVLWYSSQSQCAQNIISKTTQTNDVPLPLNTPLVNGATYYASQTIGGIESTYRLPIKVQTNLGLSSNEFLSLKYEPNPVQNILTLESNTVIKSVLVYDLLGQKVYEQSFNDSTIQINLSELYSGNYIVKLQGETTQKVIKIIKK